MNSLKLNLLTPVRADILIDTDGDGWTVRSGARDVLRVQAWDETVTATIHLRELPKDAVYSLLAFFKSLGLEVERLSKDMWAGMPLSAPFPPEEPKVRRAFLQPKGSPVPPL